jgi:hypothetical protein
MIDTTYHVIQVDGTKSTATAQLPDEPTLKDLEAIIRPILNGEPLERVRVLVDDHYTDMFVSELGQCEITTRGPLPINIKATKIYRANWLKAHPSDDPDKLPTIAGVAVLFERPVWF